MFVWNVHNMYEPCLVAVCVVGVWVDCLESEEQFVGDEIQWTRKRDTRRVCSEYIVFFLLFSIHQHHQLIPRFSFSSSF